MTLHVMYILRVWNKVIIYSGTYTKHSHTSLHTIIFANGLIANNNQPPKTPCVSFPNRRVVIRLKH